MKRGYLARKPRKRRVKGTPKMLGKSAVVKGPARDPQHLERVRAHPCIMETDGRVWPEYQPGLTARQSEAHHVRCIAPRTMGKRVSDYLTVPLCFGCHSALHGRGDEAAHWKAADLNPAEWIARFSPEGAAEIARLNGARAKPSDVSEDHHA